MSNNRTLARALAVLAAPLLVGTSVEAATLPADPSLELMQDYCTRDTFTRREIRRLQRSDGFGLLLEYTLEYCPAVAAVLASGATAAVLEEQSHAEGGEKDNFSLGSDDDDGSNGGGSNGGGSNGGGSNGGGSNGGGSNGGGSNGGGSNGGGSDGGGSNPDDDGPDDDGPEDDGPQDDGPDDDGPEDDGPEDDGPEDDGPEDDGPQDNV